MTRIITTTRNRYDDGRESAKLSLDRRALVIIGLADSHPGEPYVVECGLVIDNNGGSSHELRNSELVRLTERFEIEGVDGTWAIHRRHGCLELRAVTA